MKRSLCPLLLALALAAPAFATSGPHPAVQLAEWPSDEWLTRASALERQLLPGLEGELDMLGYQEVQLSQRHALVTVHAAIPATYVLLVYSGNRCQIAEPGLRVPRDHVLTLSAQLPRGNSLLRLLAFAGAPDADELQLLASYPNRAGSAAVVGQRWLHSSSARAAAPLDWPWEDPFDFNTRFLGLSALPLVYARLDTDLTVHSKDCAVSFNGIERLRLTDTRPAGTWPLGPGDRVELEFNLPRGAWHPRAALVLGAAAGAGEVELFVNDFGVPPELAQLSGNPAVQGLAVGPYLREGPNRIEIRAGAFAAPTELLSVELWVE